MNQPIPQRQLAKTLSFGADTTLIDGVNFCAKSLKEAVETIVELAREPGSRALAFVNSHGLRENRYNSEFSKALSCMSHCFADGFPVALLIRVHGRGRSWVPGPDFMGLLLARSSPADRHFLLGSSPAVLNDLAGKLSEKYGANIVGMHSPPFDGKIWDTISQTTKMINASNPKYLWVGLGCPKQEIWAAAALPHLKDVTVICVGAAFDFLSGHSKRAPAIFRKTGTEWMHRLASEPRRLFGRYWGAATYMLPLFIRTVFDRVSGRL